jgi:hypothetical protein
MVLVPTYDTAVCDTRSHKQRAKENHKLSKILQDRRVLRIQCFTLLFRLWLLLLLLLCCWTVDVHPHYNLCNHSITVTFSTYIQFILHLFCFVKIYSLYSLLLLRAVSHSILSVSVGGTWQSIPTKIPTLLLQIII